MTKSATIYNLYKREHPGYEFEQFGSCDISTEKGVKELMQACFNGGRWMYDSVKAVPVTEDPSANQLQVDL